MTKDEKHDVAECLQAIKAGLLPGASVLAREGRPPTRRIA